MATETAGSRRLREWLAATERSRASLGDEIGVTGQAVSLWISGKCPPSEAYWTLLEAITGIPGVEFLTDERRAEYDERQARLTALRDRPAAPRFDIAIEANSMGVNASADQLNELVDRISDVTAEFDDAVRTSLTDAEG